MDAPIYLFALVAFIGGIISFLSPCTAVILPAFFANTFKEKADLLKATTLFFGGLALIYIPLGLSGTLIAKLVFANRELVGPALGIIFVVLGALLLLGKNLYLPNFATQFTKRLPARFQNDWSLSSFGMGILSGLGSTPCAGPILGVILTLAASTKSLLIGSTLMFVYTAGLFVPLFVLALLFDRTPAVQKIIRGKTFRLKLFGYNWQIHSTNLLAAGLFFALGGLFLRVGNSYAFTSWYTKTGLLDWVFDFQDKLIQFLYFGQN